MHSFFIVNSNYYKIGNDGWLSKKKVYILVDIQ